MTMDQIGNNLSTIVVTNLSNYDYRSSWKQYWQYFHSDNRTKILDYRCSLVCMTSLVLFSMTMGQVGNNLSIIVVTNLSNYDHGSSLEPY